MTEITNSFASIKRELASFQHNQQQLRQRLNQINQTRSKINNQLVNLTKDYQRKIKQLQNKLEQTINKNEELSKENRLYKKQMQAFQSRLLEKEKLISMLILQQSERFSSESHLGRSKNQYQKASHKLKQSKKVYENMLPQSVNTIQTIHFSDKPNQVNQQAGNKFTKKQRQQGQNFQQKSQTNKPQKHHKPSHQNQHIHQTVSIEQQLAKNQQEKYQTVQKQEIQKSFNDENEEEKDVINTSRTKTVPPPPPPRGVLNKNKNKGPQMPKTPKIIQSFNNQQFQPKKESQIIENNEQKIVEKTKESPSNFNNLENVGTENNEQKDQNSEKIQQSINSQERKSRIPPPPPRANKSKVQKKSTPMPIFEPKFLQDKGSTPKKQQQLDQQEYEQARHNAEDNNQNIEQFEVLRQDNQEKQQDQPSNKTPLSQAFGFEQMNEQVKAESNQKNLQNENIQEEIEKNENEQTQHVHHSVPPPPPPKNSSKTSKNKTKNPPSLPKQIKTFHTQQITQQVPQQQQHQQHQQNPYQFQTAPHCSQDFFANLGTDQGQSNQDYSSQHKNPMMQVEQSSIDYADAHSVVSSSVAAYMLDSQYIPEQSTYKQTTTPDVKRMSKKKQGKREVKHIDPESFV